MTKTEIAALRKEAHVLRAGAGGNRIAAATSHRLDAMANEAESKNKRSNSARTIPWWA